MEEERPLKISRSYRDSYGRFAPVLAGLLILAIGATAYAQAPKLDFRVSGFIDAQTFYGVNVPTYSSPMAFPEGNVAFWGSNPAWTGLNGSMSFPRFYGTTNPNFALALPRFGNMGAGRLTGNPATGTASVSDGFNKVDSHWESRAHLKFDAIMGPHLSGTIFFEIDTYRWGAPWASGQIGNGREANNFGGWTTDRLAVELKNIYIDFGLPYFGIPVPITVRAGAQPIAVRAHIMTYSDGTGVTVGIRIDPVLISPIYAKILEGNDFQDDDADVWGLRVDAKLGTFSLGAYGLYYRMNSYDFVTPAFFPGSALPFVFVPAVPGTFKSHMWWMGVYADGRAGPVDLNFDFVYDFGSIEHTPNQIVRHVRYEGWATRLKVDYPWDKFNFGVVGMYATGPDTRSTSASGFPGDYTSIHTFARRNSGYVVPPGSEQGPANGESMVVYGMEAGATGGYGLANRANYSSMSPGGFGGTWFAKLYGSVKTTSWWKVTMQGLYIGDTTSGGNTLGTAFRFPYYPLKPMNLAGVNMLRNDQRIGVELDLINEFQIYNNLMFFVGFGYLFGGDALDVGHVAFNQLGQAIGINRSIANPWALRTRLVYTF